MDPRVDLLDFIRDSVAGLSADAAKVLERGIVAAARDAVKMVVKAEREAAKEAAKLERAAARAAAKAEREAEKKRAKILKKALRVMIPDDEPIEETPSDTASAPEFVLVKDEEDEYADDETDDELPPIGAPGPVNAPGPVGAPGPTEVKHEDDEDELWNHFTGISDTFF